MKRNPAFSVYFMAPLLLVTTLNPLNSSMLATALVPIGRAFPRQQETGAWLIASLYLTAAVAQPVLGNFADKFGARRTLLSCLTVLGVGAGVGMVASSMTMLIVSRILIGFGTSGAFPCAVAMIRHRAAEMSVTPPARLLGVLATASAASVATGPPLGGLLTEWMGWRGVFFINLPLALISLLLVYSMVPKDRGAKNPEERVDWTGIGLFTILMAAFMIFLMHLTKGFDTFSLGIAGASLVTLIWAEGQSAKPFLDIRLLMANRPLTLTYLNHVIFNFINYCFFYSVPQWSQAWLGLPLALSGFVLMPVAFSSGVVSLAPTRGRAGSITEFIGIFALIMTSAALLLLDRNSTLAGLMALTFAFGISYGIVNMSNQQRLLDYAPLQHSGSAAGLLRTAQYCGAILSAPLVGYLIAGRLGDQPMHMLAYISLPLSFAPLAMWIGDMRAGRRQGIQSPSIDLREQEP